MGSAPSSKPGWGCCLGHQPSPVLWPRFHTGQRMGTLPAGGAGSAGVLPVEGSGIFSRSESVPASYCGGSPSPPLSPSAPMTSCAASSVGDRGRVLRGAAGSAIIVSLCLRAGGGCGFPVAGARAVGAAGRGWGSSYAGSVGRHSCVLVGSGCSPPRSVAVPLRGASEAGRFPPSGSPPPGGCRGPLRASCGHRRAGTGSSAVPVARIPRVPQKQAAGVSRPACPLWGASAVRRSPSPDCPPSGRAVGVRHLLSLWARVCGCGGPTLSPWPACPVEAALRGGGGGPPRGGQPATDARGVWCQALSLPRPPALWGGQPGFRDPCVPSTVGAGVKTQHRAHSVRPSRPALLASKVSEGRPRGAAFYCREQRVMSGAPPPPTARPLGRLLGSTTHVLWARACWCGGPKLSPCPECPAGAACRGGGGGPSPGGGGLPLL